MSAIVTNGVRSVGTRLDVDVAIIHVGGVQFPVTGPARYTMTGLDAVKLAEMLSNAEAASRRFAEEEDVQV